MEKNIYIKRLPKIRRTQISKMVSLNPNRFWSLGELFYNDDSRN